MQKLNPTVKINKYSKNDFNDEFVPSPIGTNNWFKPFIDKTPEWWQINNDRHFGEFGHKQFFQYLYPYIQRTII